MFSRRRRAALALVGGAVAAGGALGTAAALQSGEVLPGVVVGGIPLGGLSAGEAASRLRPVARIIERRPLTLEAGRRSWTMAPLDLGISVDRDETLRRAFRAGREDALRWMRHTFLGAQTSIAWSPAVDRPRFLGVLGDLAGRVHVEASDGEIHLAGASVTVKAPTEGVDLLPGPAASSLLDAAMRPRRGDRLRLPVDVTAPEVGEEQVTRIERQAVAMLEAPVVFSLGQRSVTLPPERVAAALRVRLVEDPETPGAAPTLVLQVAPEALGDQILAVAPFLARPPREASFVVEGSRVRVQPSEDGSRLDAASAAAALMRTRDAARREPLELILVPEPPSFTTEDARGLGIVERIAGFTTTFDPRNAPRVANIDLMVSAIDGTILRPGEVFSLNAATGPRTPRNGYQEAQVIVDGELVPGIGGGVCQVATTLFNAVFLAGVDVTERTNHSLHISKYPLGRDATVNYGSQDLKFRNDTRHGLLLKAAVTARGLAVNIYSTPTGRMVEYATSQKRNPREPAVKYVDDPTLPAGAEVVAEEGSPGFDVTVTRRVLEGGGVLHSDTFVSKYRPWKRIIRRGTGPPGLTPSPSGSP